MRRWTRCPASVTTSRRWSPRATPSSRATVVTGTFAKTIGGLQPTGRPFRLDQMVLVHVADDRIVEAWEIADLSPLWGGAAPADAADEPA